MKQCSQLLSDSLIFRLDESSILMRYFRLKDIVPSFFFSVTIATKTCFMLSKNDCCRIQNSRQYFRNSLVAAPCRTRLLQVYLEQPWLCELPGEDSLELARTGWNIAQKQRKNTDVGSYVTSLCLLMFVPYSILN